MNKLRKFKMIKNYKACITYDGDEIYSNGIFRFNISRILEDIKTNKVDSQNNVINIKDWFKTHFHSPVNEDHLIKVDITKPIILAEFGPDQFEVIDGNHRLEKAYREKVDSINFYKINGEQFLRYFIDNRGYTAFIEYWNSKLY